MENMLETCLYDSHIALGAVMSPFGGFMMPIQYSSIVAEHLAVRNGAGMFDVSHMGEIAVSGKDAEAFVSHVFSNDVSDMPSGKILYGMMLYPDGGVVDDLLVYREYAPDSYLLVVNAANIVRDFEWMKDNSRGFDVNIENVSGSWGEIAVQGPLSENVLLRVTGFTDISSLVFYTFCEKTMEGERLIISRTGYTGEDGFELYASCRLIRRLWNMLLEAGVTPCGLGCRDTLRFEAGLPLYGHELSEEINPIEAGLGMFVKCGKPEFVGKDAVLAVKTAGPARKLVGIELLDKAVPRAGYPVEADGRQIGTVTTGYRSISLDKSICMALVEAEYSEPGTRVSIRIRKKVFDGAVCKKRFYSTNYKK